MNTVMVRYRVKADRVDENRGYIERVFEALKKNQPDGLRYASFCLPDGVSFVHIATVDTKDGENPLQKTQAFMDFVADIKDRCDASPAATDLTLVGNYRLVAE